VGGNTNPHFFYIINIGAPLAPRRSRYGQSPGTSILHYKVKCRVLIAANTRGLYTATKTQMSYNQGFVREIGRGMREVNKGFRAVRRYVFPKRRVVRRTPPRKVVNRIKPRNLVLNYPERKMNELKDLSAYYVDDDPAGTTSLVNNIAEGTGINERIGRRYNLSTFSMKYIVTSPTDFSSAILRILIVYDKQPNGVAPDAADLFGSAVSTSRASTFLNIANRDRFLILAEKRINSIPIDSAHVGVIAGTIGVNCRNLPVTCDGTGGTITDITTGSLYIIAVASPPEAGGNATKPGLNYTWRLRYTDN